VAVWASGRLDVRGREAPGKLRQLPRQPGIFDEGASEAQLRVGGDAQPGPPVGLLGMAGPWRRLAQCLLEEAEAVLPAHRP